jgi:site-specific DNA recombinase
MNSETKKSKAIIYCRVSSERQKNEGHGLESQEQRCRQFAEQNGYVVSKVFKDSFTGGGDYMRRPAMQELFSFVDINAYEDLTLIFDDLKRFARETTSHIRLRLEFKMKGVKLVCLNYNFEDTPEGEFVETIMAAQGQLERQQNKRQVVQKMKARLEKGYWSFFQPPGYSFIKDPLHGKLLVPNKDASIIKEAYEGFESGLLHSQTDVMEFLRARNFREKGKKIYLEQVKRMLTKPIYAGLIEYPEWEVTRRVGHHQAIVSEQTFDNVQRILQEGRRIRTRKDIRDDFPLRGLVCTTGSNKPYTASYSTSRRGKKHPYYRDTDKDSKYFNKSIGKDFIEKRMEDFLSTVTPEQEVLDLTEALIHDEVNKREQVADSQSHELEKKLKLIQREKESYLERIGKSRNEKAIELYERRIETLFLEEEMLNGKVGNCRVLLDFGTAFSFVMEYIKNPVKQWQEDSLDSKITVVRVVFDGLAEYDKVTGFGTSKLAPIYSVFETLSTSKTQDVEMGGIEPPCI